MLGFCLDKSFLEKFNKSFSDLQAAFGKDPEGVKYVNTHNSLSKSIGNYIPFLLKQEVMCLI